MSVQRFVLSVEHDIQEQEHGLVSRETVLILLQTTFGKMLRSIPQQ